MGKQRDLSTGIVAQIQALRQQGLTQTKIAEQLGISQSSVCKALKKNCSKRTNCSGVRKTSARDNKQLRKIAVSNRFKSTSELTDLWNKQTGADHLYMDAYMGRTCTRAGGRTHGRNMHGCTRARGRTPGKNARGRTDAHTHPTIQCHMTGTAVQATLRVSVH
ncbi:hypothetical protein SRHO_G00175840 [Serrasalmus rhombeus]